MDADAILMQTLHFDGEIVLEEAAGNSLVPVVFNNLTGANFDSDPQKYQEYLKFMSEKFLEGRAFAIGGGMLEVMVGDHVVASGVVGDMTRVTRTMMDTQIERVQNGWLSEPAATNNEASLHWIAEDQAGADKWTVDLTARGCRIHDVRPNIVAPRVSVIFSLDKTRALEILGYQPLADAWIDSTTQPKRALAPRG